jgi:acyl-CoA reductase-like NAD-dependent aldehyde dehydrogenase
MRRWSRVMAERLDVLKTHKLYIGGAFPRSESGRSIAVRNATDDVIAHICRASRKDLRNAVEAARSAQPGWSARTAYNRGQILYRMAEMVEGRRDELIAAIRATTRPEGTATKRRSVGATKGKKKRSWSRSSKPQAALSPAREVECAVDRLVCFAGWADKYQQVLGCQNPVAGPYYNFTIPEPTGVVGVVAPDEPALLGLVSLIAPPLCAGNAIIALAGVVHPLPACLLGEVCATSDVPAGVVNILTGDRDELLEHLARHRELNAISAANLTRKEMTALRLGTSDNMKRVHIAKIAGGQWADPEVCESPWTIEPFIEMKTIWHPAAV